jgi:polysaccharide deacetylase family protein (PEP-CTERM system associated)
MERSSSEPRDRASRRSGTIAEHPAFVATFDLEDWFHAENVRSSLPTSDWDALESRIERNANELLDILAELDCRSTFFVLGWVARRYPNLVRRIVGEGHEVASHTDRHERLDLLSHEQFVRDLADARDALQQLTGSRVLGIRAPNFSISDAILDHLAEAGYWYDSSYFAFEAHDRYGKISTPIGPDEVVSEVRPGLLELPMTCLRFGPASLPWSGGAYFRLIPYPIFRRGVAAKLRATSWFMFYLHPWELDTEEVPPPGMPSSLRFRAYTGRRTTRRDLKQLLAEFGSCRVDESLRSRGYAPATER